MWPLPWSTAQPPTAERLTSTSAWRKGFDDGIRKNLPNKLPTPFVAGAPQPAAPHSYDDSEYGKRMVGHQLELSQENHDRRLADGGCAVTGARTIARPDPAA